MELPLVEPPRKLEDLYAPDETPISLSDSRILLAKAIDESSNGKNSFQNLTDFPPAVQTWLKKHKRVLFEDTRMISTANIATSYNQLADTEGLPDAKDKSLSRLISALMHQQQATLPTFRRSQVDDLIYCSLQPGDKMEGCCSQCSEPSQADARPDGLFIDQTFMSLVEEPVNLSNVEGNMRYKYKKKRVYDGQLVTLQGCQQHILPNHSVIGQVF